MMQGTTHLLRWNPSIPDLLSITLIYFKGVRTESLIMT